MADGEAANLPVPTREANGRWLPGVVTNPKGYPSSYTQELGERIADLLAVTPRGLQWLCLHTEGFPSYVTVLHWMGQHRDFERLIARARQKQADTLVDECLEIADDFSRDRIIVYNKGQAREVVDLAGMGRANIRINTRIRLAKMLHPQKYGDKLDITSKIAGYVSQDDAIDELE